MTPKYYAEELVLKYLKLQEPNYNWFHKGLAKQCALIAVGELIEECSKFFEAISESRVEYWKQVKTEIIKL